MMIDFAFAFVIAFVFLQASPTTQLYQLQDLNTLIGSGFHYSNTRLSPDSSRIAWLDIEFGVCVYEFAIDDVECATIPWDEAYPQSLGNLDLMYFQWSTDGTMLAFSEYPFGGLSFDSDIWIYDLDKGMFHNITEDSITWYLDNVDDGDVSIDFLPLWGAENELYFFRTYVNDESLAENRLFDGLQLYRFSLNANEPVLVADFSPVLSPYIRSASISPDGQNIAVFGFEMAVARNPYSVWTINTQDGAHQKVTDSSFLGEEVTWLPNGANSIIWDSHQRYLILGALVAERVEAAALLQNYFYIDLANESLIALVNPEELLRQGVVCGSDLYYFYGNRRNGTLARTVIPPQTSSEVMAMGLEYENPSEDAIHVANDAGLFLLNNRTLASLDCD